MTAFACKLELMDTEFACLKRIVSEYISDQSADKSRRSAADGLLLKVQNAENKDMMASTSGFCWLSPPSLSPRVWTIPLARLLGQKEDKKEDSA